METVKSAAEIMLLAFIISFINSIPISHTSTVLLLENTDNNIRLILEIAASASMIDSITAAVYRSEYTIVTKFTLISNPDMK